MALALGVGVIAPVGSTAAPSPPHSRTPTLLLSADWPSWRGGALQGHSPGAEGPLRWSPTESIAWKTAIPGHGYSSPIVLGDAVYVTTAWPIPQRIDWRGVGGHAQIALLLLLAALGARFAVRQVRAAGRPDWAGLGAFVLGILAVCALVLAGERVIQFSRSAERGWAAGGLMGTLCLGLSSLYARTRGRRAGGAALLLFAGILALLAPTWERVGQVGVVSGAGLKTVAVLAPPALLGLALLLWPRRREGDGVRPGLPAAFRAAAVLLAAAYVAYANSQPQGPKLMRAIVCVDRESGAIRWTCEGLAGPRGPMHADNSAATPTPATDGARVYAYFGAAGAMCANAAGRLVWENRELPYLSSNGAGTSPVLYDGKLLILSESSAGRALAALDADTGHALWRVDRRGKTRRDTPTYRTPLLLRVAGRETVVVWGVEDLTGYDPASGEELWSHPLRDLAGGADPVSDAVSDGASLYLVGPAGGLGLRVAGLAGPAMPILWERRTGEGPQCASPVLHRGLLFAVTLNGVAYCLDAASGDVVWRKSLGRPHYASPLLVGERLYFCDTHGRTTVVSADRSGAVLARSDLGEAMEASPAPAGSALLLRTAGHLWCTRE